MSPALQLYVLAGLGAVLTTALSVPLWRTAFLHAEWVDDPGARKIHDQPVPLAGGTAVMTGLLLAAVMLGLKLHEEITWPDRSWLAVTAGALCMFLLGLVDDRIELGAGVKFAGQLAIALGVALGGVRLTLFIPSVAASHVLTVLWILTITNAFNFMDNMNGLCGGLGTITASAVGLNAASGGQPLMAAAAFAISGALLGFLPWNFPRAAVFLGDSGSHLVGFLLAVLTILPDFHSPTHPNRWAVLKPVLILGVPLLDLAWVVALRWRLGRPVYLGDTNHLSHQLVRRGFSPVQAVALLWFVAALAGAASLLF